MMTGVILLAQNMTLWLLRCSSFSNIFVIYWFLFLMLSQIFKKQNYLLAEVTLTREDESSIKRYVSPPYSVYLMFQTASISEQEYSEDIRSNASF